MNKWIYNPLTLQAPIGHFERAVRLGDWLFISGTSALTNVAGKMSERKLVKGIRAQANETLDNIVRVLESAGGRLSQIYEMRIIVRRREDFAIVDEVLTERIPGKGFIAHGYQGDLLHPDMELEIEANAYLGSIETIERVGRL